MTLLNGFNPRLRSALVAKTAQAYVPAALAADATTQWPIFYAEKACRILRVSIIPQAAITGADTDSMTLNVVDKALVGVGTTVLGTKAYTSGVNVIAFNDDTLVAETAAKTVAAGAVVNLERAKVGTGLAMPQLLVVVTYELIGQ